jgi:hypothetical protein
MELRENSFPTAHHFTVACRKQELLADTHNTQQSDICTMVSWETFQHVPKQIFWWMVLFRYKGKDVKLPNLGD